MDRTRKVNQKGMEAVMARESTNEYHKYMGGSNQRVV